MNRLRQETSPYLRQHADNPVHWWPWGASALSHAEREDKPILLSIGYAACHWCHVMAHESFENPVTAALMNEMFVNIKVDREERPEIDQIYMAALTAMGEQGGWPLTMFLTPNGDAFWGGTYFPPVASHGRSSFTDVLNAVHEAWITRRAEISNSAIRLSDHVSARLCSRTDGLPLSRDRLASYAARVAALLDDQYGGLRGAPKFPNAPLIDLLWLDALERRDDSISARLIESLRMMLAGGIYDHIGGGLSRYSTDAQWIIPHFEKMLYDNAQLIRHCCLAYSRTGDDLFSNVIEQTIAWLDREMSTSSGAFASSLDADSEGEEGKFYSWTADEITKALGNDVDGFFDIYALATTSSWHGNPVLMRRPGANRSGYESKAALISRLLASRMQRVPPRRDDKVLTDWNGLMIRALAEAGRLFRRDDWISRASKAYHSITESMDTAGRLPHSSLDGNRLYPCYSSDYAAMINAAVALHEATKRQSYLADARLWFGLLEQWHGDGEGGHYFTAADAADTPMRIRGDNDDATASATSQVIDALTRLSSALSDVVITLKARRSAELAMGRIESQHHGQAGIISAAAMTIAPMKLVIAGAPDGSLARIARENLDPRRVDIILDSNSDAETLRQMGFTPQDRETAWLCSGATCLPPIQDPADLKHALRNAP